MADVILSVNGMEYSGWKGISINRSLSNVAGTFSLSVTDKWSVDMMPIGIQPGDECCVIVAGQPVITGYVDKTSIGITATDISFEVSGRSKTCDLIDCSAVADSMEFKGQTLDNIANALIGPFGIGLSVEADCGDPFKKHAVQPGETVHECLDRAAAQRGVILTTNGQGQLVFATAGNKSASDALVQGQNILSIRVDRDHKNRYQKYTVNAQEPTWETGGTEPQCNIKGESIDSNVTRYRPLYINSEMQGNTQSAQQRAENEATCRAGQCTQISVSVQGWTQSGGALWEDNMLVSVNCPRAQIFGVVFVIDSINYTVNNSSGTICNMALKRPDAYMKNCAGEVKNDWYD